VTIEIKVAQNSAMSSRVMCQFQPRALFALEIAASIAQINRVGLRRFLPLRGILRHYGHGVEMAVAIDIAPEQHRMIAVVQPAAFGAFYVSPSATWSNLGKQQTKRGTSDDDIGPVVAVDIDELSSRRIVGSDAAKCRDIDKARPPSVSCDCLRRN
jgi:hypothetical protein